MTGERSVKSKRITIVGAGAIGGLAGAYMVREGVDVMLADVNADHVKAMNENGLTIRGVRGEFHVKVSAVNMDELEGPLGAVAVACKAQHTEAAVESVAPHLGPDGFIFSLQNGFNEEVIAEMIGAERVVGGLPDFGGAYLDPGLIEHTTVAPIYIGELDGMLTPRVEFLAEAFSKAFPVEITDDITARLWSKAVHVQTGPLKALVNARYSAFKENEYYKPLAVMVISEGVKAADAAGITLPPSRYLDPDLFRVKTPEDVQKAYDFLNSVIDVLGKHKDESEKAGEYTYVKKSGGLWWDLVIRKRKTELRWINGRLIEKGKEAGIEMPLSERMCNMIYEIEDGKREMGWHNLDEMAAYAKEIGCSLPGLDW